MIKGGVGGANTQTGLRFEERIRFSVAISKLPDYEVVNNKIFYKDKLVAELFPKRKLYNFLLKRLGVNYTDYISKRLEPDEAILAGNTLFIVEMKFQTGQGSVDEKLQTCHFKKRQYDKPFSKTGINVEYIYILNDWFKAPAYKDVLDYIEEVGCYYFFNEIPLEFLRLTGE